MPVRCTSRTPLRRKQGSPSNRLGALAIALAAISVVTYIGAIPWSSYVTSHPDASPGKLAGLVFVIPPMAAVASAGIGIAALLRARRGAVADASLSSAFSLEPCSCSPLWPGLQAWH